MKNTAQTAHAETLGTLNVQLAVLQKVYRDNYEMMEANSANWSDVSSLNHIVDILNNAIEFITGTTI